MTQICDCRLQLREGAPCEDVHVEIPDKSWAVLTEFLEHAETLFNSRATNALHVNARATWTKEFGMTFSAALPPDDDVATLLHRMRPFILQKESTYLPKVCNILTRYIAHDGFRRRMKGVVNEFSGKNFCEQLKIDVNGVVLNADAMVNNWLNGFEFHHAVDAKEALEVFKTMLPEKWQRAIFISMIVDKARGVGNTSIVVRWLARRDEQPLALAG